MANKTKQRQSTRELAVQLSVTFVLPIIVLMRFSGPEALGQVKALLLALSFPIMYELFKAGKHKKMSGLSALSIGGILVTGLLSLLKLSATWLALRRSIPYVCIGAGILIAQKVGHPLVEKVATQIFDMNKIAATIKNPKKVLAPLFKRTAYLASSLFAVVAVSSYVLTKVVVTAPLDSTEFNQQYAQLRLLSIAFITLPLLIGFVSIIWYLITKLEKSTGLEVEEFMNR